MIDKVVRHKADCERPKVVIRYHHGANVTESHCLDCGARAMVNGDLRPAKNMRAEA
jgi:hypothetical protein